MQIFSKSGQLIVETLESEKKNIDISSMQLLKLYTKDLPKIFWRIFSNQYQNITTIKSPENIYRSSVRVYLGTKLRDRTRGWPHVKIMSF